MMFIFEFLFGTIQLVMAGACGLYIYKDYKSGFRTSKEYLENASHFFRRVLRIQEDGSERANQAVSRYASNLGLLREAVATIQANFEQSKKLAGEQKHLAESFRELEEQALRQQDEVSAQAAAVATINHNKRAELFEENAKKQVEAATILQTQLDQVEAEFEVVKTKAETIKVYDAIAAANRQLYTLISSVEAETGLTPAGELDKLLLGTEHEKIKSEKLLGMAQNNNGAANMRRILETEEIEKELDNARKRIALPAPHQPINGEYLEIEVSS